jgi:hypothetical protein
MSLMRRVESRRESEGGTGAPGARSKGSARARSDKGSTLYVQPAELARKLVKELEDHKVVRPGRVLVCNRYTIFLCSADHDRLRDREREISAKLEHHLSKHARAKKYDVPGEIAVALVMDRDLTAGHFGILAERVDPAGVGGAGPAVPAGVSTVATPVVVASAIVPAAPARAPVPRIKPGGGSTEVIPLAEAAQMGLARQTIVLTAGNRVREFHHGRVIVGRARDADFQVDDPNVSRRHAAIFWVDGGIMVEDLDSTNGTLVNGCPVASAVLCPGDVVVIGDCRITVETR